MSDALHITVDARLLQLPHILFTPVLVDILQGLSRSAFLSEHIANALLLMGG